MEPLRSRAARAARSVLAAAAFVALAACDATGTAPLNALGYSALAKGDHGAALRWANLGIALAPKRWEAYTIRAMALNGMRRHFDALASARTAQRLGKGRPPIRYALAEALYGTAQFDELIALLGTSETDAADPISARLAYLRTAALNAVELARPVEASFEQLAERAVAGQDTCRVIERPSQERQNTWTVEAVSFVPGCTQAQITERLETYVDEMCGAGDPGARCRFTWVVPQREYRCRIDYSNGSSMETHFAASPDWSSGEGSVTFANAEQTHVVTTRGQSQSRDGGTLGRSVVSGGLPDIGWYLAGCRDSHTLVRQWFLAHPCAPTG